MYKYRSLDAWKLSHELCIATLRAIDVCYRARSRFVFDQLGRAVVSVETNIVEGYALQSAPQLRKHLKIAIASAAEAECLLETAGEMEYFDCERTTTLRELADRTLALLIGLLRSIE